MEQQREIIESRWLSVDGMRLHARVSVRPVPQDRPPIVLVHGQVVSSRYMVPTARELAPDFRVFAPDLPGFGRSAKPRHVLRVPELADALLRWMDAAGLERPVLVGNSMGCQFITDLAARHPDRVLRAVLQGPTTDPEARSLRGQVGRWIANSLREPPSMGPILIKDFLQAGPRRTVLTIRRNLLGDRIEDKLPRVVVPTLVVRGENDPIVPQRWAEQATRLLPQGRLVVIPGVAHTINFTAPRQLARVVCAFVGEGEALA